MVLEFPWAVELGLAEVAHVAVGLGGVAGLVHLKKNCIWGNPKARVRFEATLAWTECLEVNSWLQIWQVLSKCLMKSVLVE